MGIYLGASADTVSRGSISIPRAVALIDRHDRYVRCNTVLTDIEHEIGDWTNGLRNVFVIVPDVV